VSYGKTVSIIIAVVFGGVVLCLTGTMFSTMTEIARDYIPDRKLKLSSAVIIVFDVSAVVFVAGVIYIFCRLFEGHYDVIIECIWEICGGVAAPVMLSVLWKKTSKIGIIAGIITAVVVSCVWMWLPVYENASLNSVTGIDACLVSFVAGMLAVLIFSFIFKNKDKEEMEVFQRMMIEQR
jgi:Na+/proline symporter